MTDITISPNDAKKIAINRIYKTTPDYTIVSKGQVGISQGDLLITDSTLDVPIPITKGTINDTCVDAYTGSSGGDNTTDNTTTYKVGGETTDNTSQNLIKNATNATGIWTKAPATNFDSALYFGCWIYIKDATALAKFKSSGTCLTFKIGSDSSNYYYKNYTVAELSTGWNWLTTINAAISTLSTIGTPGSPLDLFIIEIITNNSTDTFTTGDVLLDCIRTYNNSNLKKTIVIESIDETNFEVTQTLRLETVEGSGFLLNSLDTENTDATPKLDTLSKYPVTSKSDTDIIEYTIIKRLED